MHLFQSELKMQFDPIYFSLCSTVRLCCTLTVFRFVSLQVVEDWKFVSMVLDRFFLWVFTLSCVGGTLGIIFESPSLYDTRVPVDQQLSEIPLRKNNFMLPADIVRINLD